MKKTTKQECETYMSPTSRVCNIHVRRVIATSPSGAYNEGVNIDEEEGL